MSSKRPFENQAPQAAPPDGAVQLPVEHPGRVHRPVMKVHPVAALFPLMSEEELNDLAADIEANGQIHPIITGDVNGEETLFDGRNRFRACEIAGVEPRFEKLIGHHDPVAFILSNNIMRRQMTKGQIAMAVAKVYPDPEKGGRGQKSLVAKEFSGARLSQARLVLHFAPDFADAVLAGSTPLDAAYAIARQRKVEQATTEEKMAQLRAEASDLAELVVEERSTIDDALGRLKERKTEQALLETVTYPDLVERVNEGRLSVVEAVAIDADRHNKEANARQAATSLLSQVVTLIGGLIDIAETPEQAAADLMANFDGTIWLQLRGDDDNSATQQLKTCGVMLIECARLLKARTTDPADDASDDIPEFLQRKATGDA